MPTCPYNVDTLEPCFYIVKVFFLFLLNYICCGYLLELPQLGGSLLEPPQFCGSLLEPPQFCGSLLELPQLGGSKE